MENDNEKTIEYLEKHIPEMAQAAVKQAYWQALASGRSVLISDDGFIKEIFPDGTFRVVEQTEPFIEVEKGRIIVSK
ncbi:MAG: hypothetical protein ACR2L1_01120 [Pyrinomonadaceae bacterium]